MTWMAFIMRVCKKYNFILAARSTLCFLGVILPCLFASYQSFAAGIFVRSAETILAGKIYRLNANINYRLTDEVVNALHNGVPLVIIIEIHVLRNREYIWDVLVATLKQKYQLSYHALTKRYLLKSLNTNVKRNFSTLGDALLSMGRLRNFPLLDKKLLDEGETYTARLRSLLDVDQLPTPLRLLAFFSPDWHLDSEWYLWPLQD